MCGSASRQGARERADQGARSTAPGTGERAGQETSGPAAGLVPDSPTELRLRASDGERERVADALRRHAAAGRLEVEELDERVSRAFGARTRGDLQPLLADLPALEPAQAPPDGGSPEPAPAPGWSGYLAVMALLVGIWLLTGAGHPWPLYPALGWGIPLLVARAAGRHPAIP